MTKKTIVTTTKRPTISAEVVDGLLVIEFSNGEQLEVAPAMLSDEIRNAAMLHGLKQKLVDAAAIARNTDTGLSASIDDKIAAVREVYARITSPNGTWNKVREAGAGSGGGNGLLLRALMQYTGKDKATVEAYLDEKTAEEKKALRTNGKIAAIIAELQRAKAGVDSDELLGELL